MGTIRRNRGKYSKKAIEVLPTLYRYFGFEISKGKTIFTHNSNNSISNVIASYIISSLEEIKSQKKYQQPSKKPKRFTNLSKDNVVALEYSPFGTGGFPKQQVDYFSFRLQDLSSGYHFNSLNPNLLRTSLEKEGKLLSTDGHIKESPNFTRYEKLSEKIIENVEKEDETKESGMNNLYENLNPKQSSAEKSRLVFNPAGNYKRTKTLENYKIIQQEANSNQHLNKSANEIMNAKEVKHERRLSNEIVDNSESILNDNNSVSNGSEIENLRRDFADNASQLIKQIDISSNVNNISVSNLDAEKTVSEASSTNNFSLQDVGNSNMSQEKFKKIRGFNFKNNVNTKKFSRQNMVGKNSSIEKKIVVDININNSSISNNTNVVNESSASYVTNRGVDRESSEIDKGGQASNLKMKRFNFHNNNINLKKYKSPSPHNNDQKTNSGQGHNNI